MTDPTTTEGTIAGTAEGATREVDVVVVGGGPVGENVAQYAHDGGLDVALVEEGLVGGECSYHACIPSKALLEPLRVARTSATLPGISPARVHGQDLLRRRDDWVSHYDDAGQARWVAGAGITLVRGRGVITAEREVTVGTVVLRARTAVVLATGSTPVVPDRFAAAHPWTSADAAGLVEVPGRVVVVGGGVVAVEAATWLAGLGSRVTLLARGGLLTRFEEGVGELVADGLRQAGVDVRLGVEVTDVERRDAADTGLGRLHGGAVTVVAGPERYEADELLLALGRTPVRDGLGLEAVGLDAAAVDDGRLPAWLHVIGDAGSGARLTHMGKYEARVLGSRLAGVDEHVPTTPAPTPQVVFSSPQVAAVGATEREARASGREVVTAQVPIGAAAGVGLAAEDPHGMAKVVVDGRSGVLLGASFVGPEVAELVHGATVAIVGQVPVRVLRHAVPSFPTASELWLRLLEELPVALRR